MKSDIQKYVAKCDTCQQKKFEIVAPPGLLQHHHIRAKKWSKISMNFITVLLMFDGNDSIFVIVDRLTEYAHFIAISSKEKASQVA